MKAKEWKLDASIGASRLSGLADPPGFTEIAEAIRTGMKVLCCHPERCDLAAGFERFVYCLNIGRELFDLFFNSRNGYRAAFFRSPYEGLRANAELLAMLTPSLVASEATGGEKASKLIEESLTSPTAKVWLAEPEVGFCSLCAGEWSNPSNANAEIRNGRWECSSHDNAKKGRKAPYFTKLRVFGAFLNHASDEVIAGRKRHRAVHLNQWGWA